MVAALLVLMISAQAAPPAVPLRDVPTTLPTATRIELETSRSLIQQRVEAFNTKFRAFQDRCSNLTTTDSRLAACTRDHAALLEEQKQVVAEKQAFAARVDAAIAANPVNTDSRVVDTRGVEKLGAEWIAKVPELANSREAERIRKGFAAVLAGDWPVALAWWQDALNRDPTNAALRRSVDLAQWTIDYRKQLAARPPDSTAAQRQAVQGNYVTAFMMLIAVKRQNPGEAERAVQTFDHMYGQNPRYREVRDAYLLATGGRVVTEQELARWRNAEDLWLWSNVLNRQR